MEKQKETGLTITGINIPFWNMVLIMVKIAIATIPAAILVMVAYFFLSVWSVYFVAMATEVAKGFF